MPTLDGKGKLRIPPGTQPGNILRIRGKGMPRRVTGGRGDQLIEVRVHVPKELTPRGRELVEHLAAELGQTVPAHTPTAEDRSFVDRLRDFFS